MLLAFWLYHLNFFFSGLLLVYYRCTNTTKDPETRAISQALPYLLFPGPVPPALGFQPPFITILGFLFPYGSGSQPVSLDPLAVAYEHWKQKYLQ